MPVWDAVLEGVPEPVFDEVTVCEAVLEGVPEPVLEDVTV